MNINEKEFLVQKIRTQYTEKEITELDTLKELDRKVKKPANVFAGVWGTLSAIIMGSGMSLIMTDIAATLGISNSMVIGIAVGVAGLVMSLLTYPMYKGILNSRRQKYADKIIELSDKIMNK